MVTVCVCVRARVCASCRKYTQIEQFLSRQTVVETDMPYGITHPAEVTFPPLCRSKLVLD